MRIAIAFLFAAVLCLSLPGFAAAQSFQATLTGLQSVPPNDSQGIGIGCMTYDAGTQMLMYEIAFSNLEGTETIAHFHGPAAPGVEAGVLYTLLPTGSPKLGQVGPLSVQELADLNAGLWYINIHSNLYAPGEIRGQVVAATGPCTVATEDRTWGSIKAMYNAD